MGHGCGRGLLALAVAAAAALCAVGAGAQDARASGAGAGSAPAGAAGPRGKAAPRSLVRPRGSVPHGLLDGLPRRLHRAVQAARGMPGRFSTSGMVREDSLVREFMLGALCELAARAYTREYFGGKTIKRYYTEILDRLEPTVWKSWNAFGGTMYHVVANNEMTEIVDEYIVCIVREQTDAAYFRRWKRRWVGAWK